MENFLMEVAKSSRYHAKHLQSPLRHLAFIVSVALFRAFQAAQTAQGIIDRLRFAGVKAGDVAQFFEPCRNFNLCISDSPRDLGILQFHHRHSVKVYPKLFNQDQAYVRRPRCLAAKTTDQQRLVRPRRSRVNALAESLIRLFSEVVERYLPFGFSGGFFSDFHLLYAFHERLNFAFFM
jgi:hypothetical protein